MGYAAISFCHAHPDFIASHMNTSRAQMAAALPAHALNLRTMVIANLVERAHSTCGTLLRDAAHETLLVFPTLVLRPQCRGASSSSVKTEVTARLDLLRGGLFVDLALCAKVQARARPSS